MSLPTSSTRTGSEHISGPVLMLSILAVILGLFVLIGIFTHRHNRPEPRNSAPPHSSNLPTQ